MMRPQRRLMICLAVSMLVLLPLTGCGQNAAGSSGSQSGFTGTPGSVQLVKTSTLQTMVPTRLPSPPPAPQPMRGTVVLHVDAVPQSAHEAITFTLHNQTNQAIFFADHQSGCTVILLQMVPGSQDNGQWQTLAPCKALTMTRLHMLEAGQNLTITFNPPSGQWTPGLYRGVLNYALAETDGQGQTIFSSIFKVGT
ncbi:MAG: hypothetical protein AUH05_16080 [Ktedonobacter sp. 13_2_20CM_53_11]|nr:MAG: hypothetical protein AUH05_16080 [Ktedonobacter sp. 13_2_20CM_53_11]